MEHLKKIDYEKFGDYFPYFLGLTVILMSIKLLAVIYVFYFAWIPVLCILIISGLGFFKKIDKRVKKIIVQGEDNLASAIVIHMRIFLFTFTVLFSFIIVVLFSLVYLTEYGIIPIIDLSDFLIDLQERNPIQFASFAFMAISILPSLFLFFYFAVFTLGGLGLLISVPLWNINERRMKKQKSNLLQKKISKLYGNKYFSHFWLATGIYFFLILFSLTGFLILFIIAIILPNVSFNLNTDIFWILGLVYFIPILIKIGQCTAYEIYEKMSKFLRFNFMGWKKTIQSGIFATMGLITIFTILLSFLDIIYQDEESFINKLLLQLHFNNIEVINGIVLAIITIQVYFAANGLRKKLFHENQTIDIASKLSPRSLFSAVLIFPGFITFIAFKFLSNTLLMESSSPLIINSLRESAGFFFLVFRDPIETLTVLFYFFGILFNISVVGFLIWEIIDRNRDQYGK